jgi:aminopeptidase N
MDCPDEDTVRSFPPCHRLAGLTSFSQIQQIFDAISYSKGASVLKMLSNMIGEKTFLHGVSLYLKSHTYGNARTADLWAGISEASGKEVNDIMYNWTNKASSLPVDLACLVC